MGLSILQDNSPVRDGGGPLASSFEGIKDSTWPDSMDVVRPAATLTVANEESRLTEVLEGMPSMVIEV